MKQENLSTYTIIEHYFFRQQICNNTDTVHVSALLWFHTADRNQSKNKTSLFAFMIKRSLQCLNSGSRQKKEDKIFRTKCNDRIRVNGFCAIQNTCCLLCHPLMFFRSFITNNIYTKVKLFSVFFNDKRSLKCI